MWIKHLSDYIHSIDLVNAKPMPNLVKAQPENSFVCTFGVEGQDYNIYLADDRELDEAGAGELIKGQLIFDLPQDDYKISFYSPVAGSYDSQFPIAGGKDITISVPAFEHDLVVRIKRC